jgi:ribonuclease VapC
MFVDASALVAILTTEADAQALTERLDDAEVRSTSAIAVFEAATALARKRAYTVAEAQARVMRFLTEAQISIVAMGAAEAEAAIVAFDRYGKGRHPAALNMGDCFAYACAKTLKAPLLYKGDDFARTDLA